MPFKVVLVTLDTLPKYKKIIATFKSDDLPITPAEMQGLLSGMLCGGLNIELGTWRLMLYDYTNDSKIWPSNSIALAECCLSIASRQLLSDDLDFELLLPDEVSSLFSRAETLSEWVNAFVCGVGLVGVNSSILTDDAKEIITDLTHIAQLSIDEDDDINEQEALLEQIIEHVRVCAMTLYLELNCLNQDNLSSKPTIH